MAMRRATALGPGWTSTTTNAPHQAPANRTPMTVWREGDTDRSRETAVDMLLRLDNASALPTYPPPQQLQHKVA